MKNTECETLDPSWLILGLFLILCHIRMGGTYTRLAFPRGSPKYHSKGISGNITLHSTTDKYCYQSHSSKAMSDLISQDIAAQKKSVQSSSSEDEANHQYEYNSRNEPHFVNLLDTIISGTARLNVLLPSATILAFTNFSPLITNEGHCDHLDRWVLGLFLTVSSLFCIFFSLTDSFRTSKGRLYYGIATFSGILPLNGTRKRPHAPSEYRLRWADLFHVILSLVAFLTFAASQKDVVDCYYPHLPRKVSYVVPVLVESVIGTLIVLFPSGRKGIGYPFLLQKDTLSSSTT